jgi:hypothetical protein
MDLQWTGVINPVSTNLSGIQVQLTVDGTVALPAFGGVDYGDDIDLDRSLSSVSPGSHTVSVQMRLASCGGCSQLVNMGPDHLTVIGGSS